MMQDETVTLEEVGAFVPFPSVLLDEWLPRLKDTEWRLLCVVVRQTLGWKRGEGRKRRDWMSQSQLIKRTGRYSAALSCALDALVREGLLCCSTREGKPLLMPQERRQYRGRIYIALAPRLFEGAQEQQKEQPKRKRFLAPSAPESGRMFTGWEQAGAIFEKSWSAGPSAKD